MTATAHGPPLERPLLRGQPRVSRTGSNLDKVAIPQADEQQRLLANLIVRMNADRKPLPRFWYLPRGEKAVVVMTGDDHANSGTDGRFTGYIAASPPGCSVADWECVRSTSYIFPSTPLTDAQAAGFTAARASRSPCTSNTNCADWTPSSLEAFYDDQMRRSPAASRRSRARLNRTHCIAWSDWATQAKVEEDNGIRFDTNYYYWPGTWVQDRPGFMTGSGMPMRFADIDGT